MFHGRFWCVSKVCLMWLFTVSYECFCEGGFNHVPRTEKAKFCLENQTYQNVEEMLRKYTFVTRSAIVMWLLNLYDPLLPFDTWYNLYADVYVLDAYRLPEYRP